MKIKTLFILLIGLMQIQAYANFSMQEFEEKTAQNVMLAKKIAEANEAWLVEKSQLNARLSNQETLNARLKKELSSAKEKSEKSKLASAEILLSLEKFKAFENSLQEALKETTTSFLEKIKTSSAYFILKNQTTLDGSFKDIYSFAEATIEARVFALNASKEFNIQNVDGQEALALGICAILKKSKCPKVGEIIDILNGKSAHKIVILDIEGVEK